MNYSLAELAVVDLTFFSSHKQLPKSGFIQKVLINGKMGKGVIDLYIFGK